MTNCNFNNNQAPTDYTYGFGSAVYFRGLGNVTNCNFVNNSAQGSGGAVYFGGLGNVTNCNFTNNTSSSSGIIFFNKKSNVTNCNFVNNYVVSLGVIGGSSSNVRSSIFLLNKKTFGRDLFSSEHVFDNCWFWLGNNASNYDTNLYYENGIYSRLFLDVTATPVEGVEGKSSIVVNLKLYDINSKLITTPTIPNLPDMVFDLSATNGYLSKYSARLGETVIFTSTVNKDGNITASYNGAFCSVTIAGLNLDNPVENETDTNTTNTTSGNTSDTNMTTPEVVIPPLDTPSEDGTVEVKLPSDATGTVILTVNNKNYTFNVKNGIVNVKLPELGEGNYNYTIKYSGDSKYSSFTTNGKLNVNNTNINPIENTTNTTGNETNTTKPTPEIVVPPLDKPSEDGSVTISLPNDATGKVTLTINGKSYNYLVENGVANIIIPNLGDGNYPYTITYSGDSKYSSFTNSGSLKVNKTIVNPVENTTDTNNTNENTTNTNATNATGNNTANETSNSTSNTTKPTPEIVVPPLDKPSNEGSVKVTLPSDATGKVTLSIGGKDYIYLVENGVANVIIPNLGEGNYPYTITYSGDSKYSSFTTNGSLNKSAPKVDPKITAKNTAVQYSAKGKYSVTVYGTDGKVVSGVQVIFKISGKQVGKAKTNTKGVASYVVTKNPGKYKIQATALGKSVTKTVTVKHIVTLKTVTLKKSAKKLTLQATLAKVNGKYLKKKTIIFKINGKKVATAKTNSKGVAKITIKNPNVVKKLKVGKKVTYQATYLKDTVKKTAKVKK